MKKQPPSRPTTHLFTVRVWLEPVGKGRAEWRGKVQYVLTEEWRYFRDWPTLIACLSAMLPDDEASA
jgi:hypothetical protein